MKIVHSLQLAVMMSAALCPCAPADDGVKIGGAVLGFVFDGDAKALRAILGVPGSSLLSDPLSLNHPINKAVTASQRDYGIAVTPETDLVQITNLNGAASIQPLASGVLPDDSIRLSPSGTVAAIYRSASGHIQVFTGFPDAPVLAGEADVSSLPGSLTALAVSDDGAAVLAGFSGTDSGSVQLVDSVGNVSPLLSLAHPSSIAFLTRSRSALVADGGANKIYLVQDVTGSAQATAILIDSDGVANPVAVESSGDNRLTLVANSQSGTVLILDQAGGAPVSVRCFCVPSGLTRLSGNAVFRLTELSSGPLWLIDADAPEPRILFVPPRNEAPQNANLPSGAH